MNLNVNSEAILSSGVELGRIVDEDQSTSGRLKSPMMHDS